MRGAHAALSPSLGAPATPVAWHAEHTVSNVALPLPPAAFAPAAGATGGGTATGVTAATLVAAVGAAAAGGAAFGSTTTRATGPSRFSTAASDMAGSSLRLRPPYTAIANCTVR